MAATLLALAAVLALLARSWLERRIACELRSRGLTAVQVRVRSVSPWQVGFGPITVGSGEAALRIEAVDVRLRAPPWRQVADPSRWEIPQVTVAGLRATLATDAAGRWALGGLDTLWSGAGARPAAGPPATAGPPAAWPRPAQVVLRAAQLTVRHGRRALVVPVSGVASVRPDGALSANLDLSPGGERLRVQVETDLRPGADVRLTVDVDRFRIGPGLEWAELAGLAVPKRWSDLRGEVSCRGAVSARESGGVPVVQGYRLEAEATGLAWRGLQLGQARFTLAGQPADLAFTVDGCRAASLAGVTVQAKGHVAGDRVQVEGAVGGLRCTHARDLAMAARLDLPPWCRQVDGVADLQFRLEGAVRDRLLDRADLSLDLRELRTAGQELGSARLALTGNAAAFTARLEGAGAGRLAGVAGTVTAEFRAAEASTPQRLTATGSLSAAGAAAAGLLPGPPVALAGALGATVALSATRPAGAAWSGDVVLDVSPQAVRLAGDGLTAGATVGGRLRVSGTPALATLAGNLTATGLEFRNQAVQATAAEAGLEVLTEALPPVAVAEAVRRVPVAGRVRLVGGAASLQGGATVRGVELDWPFRWQPADGLVAVSGAGGPGEGGLSVRVSRVEGAGFALADLQATGTVSGRAVALRGGARLAEPAVPLTWEATVVWAPDGPQVGGRFAAEPLAVGLADTWYHRLPGLAHVGLSGTVTTAGEFSLDARRAGGTLTVGVEDGRVELPDNGIVVSGVRTRLVLPDLPVLRTAPHQEVVFASASVGGITLDGGRVVFQLESPQSLFLEQGQVAWCGGSVRTHAVSFNPASPDVDLTLFADGIQIARLLGLMKGFQGSGTGTLYGRLPLAFHRGRLSYQDGFLYSAPGQEGTLKLTDAGLLTRSLAETDPSYGQLKQAEKALRDFRFNLFRIDMAGRGTGDTRLRLGLAGESASDSTIGPVHLDVNVRGALEEYINLGLRLGTM